jgi:lysophospholipase L1-like esterase
MALGTSKMADAAAGAQSLTLKPTNGTTTATRVETVFGNSIAAGYCGLFCRLDSYAVYFGRDIANAKKANVTYKGRAYSGETMSQIVGRINSNTADLAAADNVVLEGCGNDYLNARTTYRGQTNCTDETVIANALATCKSQMVLALDAINAKKKAGATVTVMAIYYPGINDDKGRSCNGMTHFDIFLDYIAEGNWFTCNEAWKRGFKCVDGIAAMNAADVDTTKDADTLVDADQIRMNQATDTNNMGAYITRIMDNKAVITDGHLKVISTGATSDYLQSDNTHPTAAGHKRLGAEHTAAGI